MGLNANMVQAVRGVLLGSPRWLAETRELNVLAVAKAGPLPFESWTLGEIEETIAWAAGRAPLEPMPRVLATYLEKVRRQS